jgi:UDP-N-acetylglucosamine:LPS N-acetylglucosamine transferase
VSGRPTGEGTAAPLRVLLVCSNGGHLGQLHKLKPWWSRHERLWVTFPKADAQSLLEGEAVRWGHYPTTRNVPNLLRNLVLARRVLAEFRPDVIVSSGAGVAVPFFVLGRLQGIPTVYLEVFDRIDSATLTGRLCGPFTDLFCLQWEDQLRQYPQGTVVGPVFSL